MLLSNDMFYAYFIVGTLCNQYMWLKAVMYSGYPFNLSSASDLEKSQIKFFFFFFLPCGRTSPNLDFCVSVRRRHIIEVIAGLVST